MHIARSSPETAAIADGSAGARAARYPWERAAVRFFAASCFFPYPALAIGGNNGLQLSQAFAVAAVPYLAFRPPGRAFRALLLIMTPVVVSMLINSMAGDAPLLDIIPKEAMSLALALVVLWPSEWVSSREHIRDVLNAACAGIVVHSL